MCIEAVVVDKGLTDLCPDQTHAGKSLFTMHIVKLDFS